MNVEISPSRFRSHHLVDLEKASAMWGEDKTALEIAKVFGVSKAVIVGIAARNREAFPEKRKIAIRHPKAPSRPLTMRKKAEEAIGTEAVEVSHTDYDASREVLAKTLMEIENDECRFPIGNGGPFVFCAADVLPGSAYCAHHHLRAYRPRGEADT